MRRCGFFLLLVLLLCAASACVRDADCANGGVCSAQGACQCTGGWSGPSCASHSDFTAMSTSLPEASVYVPAAAPIQIINKACCQRRSASSTPVPVVVSETPSPSAVSASVSPSTAQFKPPLVTSAPVVAVSPSNYPAPSCPLQLVVKDTAVFSSDFYGGPRGWEGASWTACNIASDAVSPPVGMLGGQAGAFVTRTAGVATKAATSLPVHTYITLRLRAVALGAAVEWGAQLSVLVDGVQLHVVLGPVNATISPGVQQLTCRGSEGTPQESYTHAFDVVVAHMSPVVNISLQGYTLGAGTGALPDPSTPHSVGFTSIAVSVSDGVCRDKSPTDNNANSQSVPQVCVAKPQTSPVVRGSQGRSIAIALSVLLGAALCALLIIKHFRCGILAPLIAELELSCTTSASVSAFSVPITAMWCLIDGLFRTAAFSWGVVPWERVGLGAAAAFFHRFLLIVPTWWLLLIAILVVATLLAAYLQSDRLHSVADCNFVHCSSSSVLTTATTTAAATTGRHASVVVVSRTARAVSLLRRAWFGAGWLLLSVLFVPAVYILLNPWMCSSTSVTVATHTPVAYYASPDCSNISKCFSPGHWAAFLVSFAILCAVLMCVDLLAVVPAPAVLRGWVGPQHLLLLTVPLRLVMAWSGRLLIHFSPCWSVMLSLTCNVALLCVSIVWLVFGGAALCHPLIPVLILLVGVWCVAAGVTTVAVLRGASAQCTAAYVILGACIVLFAVITVLVCCFWAPNRAKNTRKVTPLAQQPGASVDTKATQQLAAHTAAWSEFSEASNASTAEEGQQSAPMVMDVHISPGHAHVRTRGESKERDSSEHVREWTADPEVPVGDGTASHSSAHPFATRRSSAFTHRSSSEGSNDSVRELASGSTLGFAPRQSKLKLKGGTGKGTRRRSLTGSQSQAAHGHAATVQSMNLEAELAAAEVVVRSALANSTEAGHEEVEDIMCLDHELQQGQDVAEALMQRMLVEARADGEGGKRLAAANSGMWRSEHSGTGWMQTTVRAEEHRFDASAATGSRLGFPARTSTSSGGSKTSAIRPAMAL